MKKLFLLCMVLFLNGLSERVIAQPNWHTTYSDVQNKSIDYTSNNEYLLCGHVQPNVIGNWNNMVGWRPLTRIQLQLLDNNLNNSLWFKTYIADDELQLVQSGQCNALSTEFYVEYAKQVSNGDYIMCGSVRRDGETGGCGAVSYNHVFIMRTDPAGNPIWYKRYDFNFGTIGYAHLYSIEETPTGFIACGERYTGPGEGLIFKIDGNGTPLWTKLVQVPAYWDPNTLLTTQYKQIIRYGSNFALVGSGNHSIVMYNVLVTLIDDNGTFVQNVNYDETYNHITLIPRSICVTNDNKLAITGAGGQPCTQGGHFMAMKVDPSTMNVDFLKIYGPALGSPYYYAEGANLKSINNRLCITGFDYSPSNPDMGLYAEVDHPTGNLLRYAIFNPNFYQWGCFVTINTALGAPVVSGNTNNTFETFVLPNQYNFDCHGTDLTCSDQDISHQNLTPVVNNYSPVEIPDKAYVFDLHNVENIVCQPVPKMGARDDHYKPTQADNTVGIYPNHAGTTIVLRGGVGQVRYEILNMTGQKMLIGEIESGATINISPLATGLYIVKAQTADGSIHILKLVKE